MGDIVMARKSAKQIELYVVRNEAGQFLGTKYAYNSQQAIDKLVSELRCDQATFRRNSLNGLDKLTAKVEQR